MLTGCRWSEVLNLRWRDIGGDALNLADAKLGGLRLHDLRHTAALAPPISLDSRLAATTGSRERGCFDVSQAWGVESDRRS